MVRHVCPPPRRIYNSHIHKHLSIQFFSFGFYNLCDVPIVAFADSCMDCSRNSVFIVHLIVDVDKVPPLLGKSPFSIHVRNLTPPVNLLGFIDIINYVTTTSILIRNNCWYNVISYSACPTSKLFRPIKRMNA